MTDNLVQTIVENEDTMIPFVIFGVGGVVAVVAIIFGAARSIAVNREREISRREIAAYIAEGSMSPDDGVQLMNAAQDKKA